MAWQTPKTNWATADGVRNTDMNRIEGNVLHLYQEKLRSNTTIYVSTTGNDSTGTGTSSAPYRTITKALSMLPKNLNGFSATINVAQGTYAEAITVRDFNGTVTFTGAAANVTATSLVVNNATVISESIRWNFTSASMPLRAINKGAFIATSGSVTASGGGTGISVYTLGSISIDGTYTAEESSVGILANNGTIHVGTYSGSNISTGIQSTNGAVVSYDRNQFSATTPFVTSAGGRIYTGSQTGSNAAYQATATLATGATSLLITNSAICPTCIVDVYTDHFGVAPTNMVVSGNTLTLTFDPQDAPVQVRVVIN